MCVHENISHATSSSWEPVCADCGEVLSSTVIASGIEHFKQPIRDLTMASCPIITLNTKPRMQKVGETRQQYLARARRFCRVAMAKLFATGEYRYCHQSFMIRDTLLAVESTFIDLGTIGVEHIPAGNDHRSPAIDFLLTGDSYELTLMFVNGRFRVGCWGDMFERGNYN